jgi:hypothetical protein
VDRGGNCFGLVACHTDEILSLTMQSMLGAKYRNKLDTICGSEEIDSRAQLCINSRGMRYQPNPFPTKQREFLSDQEIEARLNFRHSYSLR